MDARLAPDMRPLPAQYQMASDSAKNALARLAGTEAPSMPDIETSFAELKERCGRTIEYVSGFDALVAQTDPKLVWLEMDCYWVTQAGHDPLNRGLRLAVAGLTLQP